MQKDFIRLRSEIVKSIRAFFDERGYVEVHTPRMVLLPGQEPYLDPFWTTLHDIHGGTHQRALITSPEYAMKKLLAAGFDKIYDLGPCFRDHEPWDHTHAPEFLMLEWYRKGIGLHELMDETEELVRFVILNVVKNLSSERSEILRFSQDDKPFRRITVREAMLQYAGLDIEPLLGNRDAMAEACRSHGHSIDEKDTWDDLFFKIFLTEVEPKLGWDETKTEWQPTFLWNYPVSMAALARRDPADSRYALRAELYIGNLELANGFAELTDPEEQRKRFEEEQEVRRSLGKETWPIDERFMSALPSIGEAAGMAFGVDRLVMLLAGTDSISDIMPIPVRKKF
jgi:lysyl-tRNA synthetase class 2